MLTFDAKKAFAHYTGANRKPQDFDTFWNNALKELDSLNCNFSACEKIGIDIPSTVASFYSLYFTGAGGARIHAQFIAPKNPAKKPVPVMLQFHGYHNDSGDFSDKIALAAEGFYVLALDITVDRAESRKITCKQQAERFTVL